MDFSLQFVGAELPGYYGNNLAVLQRMDTLLKYMGKKCGAGIDSIVIETGFIDGDSGPYLKADMARERLQSMYAYLVGRAEHYGYAPLRFKQRLVRFPEQGSDPRKLTAVLLEFHCHGNASVISGGETRLLPGKSHPAVYQTDRIRQHARAGLFDRKPGKFAPVIAFKTDLVLWSGITPGFEVTTFLPNVAVEIYLGSRWSVECSAAYSDWNDFRGKRFHRMDAYGLAPRFWFWREHLFRGFYAGLHGYYGSFDNRPAQGAANDNTGYTGTFSTVGVSIGYAQSLSRHWFLEVALTGGYRMEKIKAYRVEGHYDYYDRDLSRNRVIPGVRLNLLYRIGRDRDSGRRGHEATEL